jgi:hypothetical protein
VRQVTVGGQGGQGLRVSGQGGQGRRSGNSVTGNRWPRRQSGYQRLQAPGAAPRYQATGLPGGSRAVRQQVIRPAWCVWRSGGQVRQQAQATGNSGNR